MKKFIALVAVLCMVFALCACGGGDSKAESLTFVTGGETGTYYGFGSVIAQYVSANSDLSVTAVTGNGSQANVQELVDGTADFAFCQSDVMAYAYNGTNLFNTKVEGFSTVAALYMEQVQIVTTNPDIKTVADLAGKSVSIGAPGSGVYFNAIDVLSAYGLTENDIKPTYQSFGDSADALKNGQIDAAFIVAGAPTTSITQLATTLHCAAARLSMEREDHQVLAQHLAERLAEFEAARTPQQLAVGVHRFMEVFYVHCGNRRLDKSMLAIQGQQLLLRNLYAAHDMDLSANLSDFRAMLAGVEHNQPEEICKALEANAHRVEQAVCEDLA